MTVDPWYEAVNNSAGDIIIEGAEQLTDWPLYSCLVLLVSTAVAQVNYINRGMVNFGNSQLIPAHYVTFTLFSILATSTFYQECRLGLGLGIANLLAICLLYTSPSPRDGLLSRMPSSA